MTMTTTTTSRWLPEGLLSRWLRSARLLRAALVLAVGAGLAAPAAAQDADAEAEDPFADFTKLVEGAEVHEGFFDLYTKDDKLWLAVERDRLDDDFLLDYRISQGIGARGLYGGTTTTYFEMDMVAFEKHGEKLYLVKRPHQFTAETDPRVRDAVDITFGSSVLESAAVAAVRPDSAYVLDVTDWFVGDLGDLSSRMRGVASTGNGPGSASFDRSRSWLEHAASFPSNTNIKAKLTFRSSQPVPVTSVPDGRYIPVTMHYTLAELPAEPMERRMADDRVGNFWTVHKDFSDDTAESGFFRRMVNRWRLEPGERVGDKWRPVKPITFYIDHNVPEEYRGYFHAGVEAWNVAFDAAGWVDAIRAEDLPEGADPDDIRYPTLRWNTSDDPGYGAIGPSKVDPRTGEILDADILFEANMMLSRRNLWRRVGEPATAAQAFEAALGVGDFEVDPAMVNQMGVELPGFTSALADQGSVVGAFLLARGELRDDEVPEAFIESSVTWVVMHEVGHSLGLQHNFRSSASTPNRRLHDESFTAENGVFSSVMEYPAVNLNPDGETGHYFNPGPGSYDRWAITYAYAPTQAEADAVTREVAERGHLYGNESGGSGALDPSINAYDLGADPLAWGAERSALVRELMFELPENVLDDNDEFVTLTEAYQSLLNEYARAVAPAVKYLGGAYMNRDHVGDGRLPFENPGKAEQERALALIIDRLMVQGALELPPEILQQMGTNGYAHFGSSRTFSGGRYDYPFLEEVLDLQTSVLGQLLYPSRLQRMRTLEARFGEGEMVTIPEMMGALTSAVWSELGSGAIAANRRDLQRAYIDAMTALIVDPAEGTPADARAVARWELERLAERVAAAEATDAYTMAHLNEVEARIAKALEAGLVAEGS